jgi:hypothetical protein
MKNAYATFLSLRHDIGTYTLVGNNNDQLFSSFAFLLLNFFKQKLYPFFLFLL